MPVKDETLIAKTRRIALGALNVAKAATTGKRVSAERIEKRVEICAKCNKVQVVKKKGEKRMRCGICGCKVLRHRAIMNLATYEETKGWGCKHPKGSRWKKNGV